MAGKEVQKKTKKSIAKNWLHRYTGTHPDEFGKYVLLTNFSTYLHRFAEKFKCNIRGLDSPFQTATSKDGLTMINFQMGSANAATCMDLLSGVNPNGVLFLGKCGGLKRSTEIGHFLLPIAAIRGEGTSDDYLAPEVPALPSFKLHKYVSEVLQKKGIEYRTGVIYTTNRRIWEHDERFKRKLKHLRVIGIDMETATLFAVGFVNEIARGALLLVSDTPMTPEGVKTEISDRRVTKDFLEMHLDIGIKAMTGIGKRGETIKHFRY